MSLMDESRDESSVYQKILDTLVLENDKPSRLRMGNQCRMRRKDDERNTHSDMPKSILKKPSYFNNHPQPCCESDHQNNHFSNYYFRLNNLNDYENRFNNGTVLNNQHSYENYIRHEENRCNQQSMHDNIVIGQKYLSEYPIKSGSIGYCPIKSNIIKHYPISENITRSYLLKNDLFKDNSITNDSIISDFNKNGSITKYSTGNKANRKYPIRHSLNSNTSVRNVSEYSTQNETVRTHARINCPLKYDAIVNDSMKNEAAIYNSNRDHPIGHDLDSDDSTSFHSVISDSIRKESTTHNKKTCTFSVCDSTTELTSTESTTDLTSSVDSTTVDAMGNFSNSNDSPSDHLENINHQYIAHKKPTPQHSCTTISDHSNHHKYVRKRNHTFPKPTIKTYTNCSQSMPILLSPVSACEPKTTEVPMAASKDEPKPPRSYRVVTLLLIYFTVLVLLCLNQMDLLPTNGYYSKTKMNPVIQEKRSRHVDYRPHNNWQNEVRKGVPKSASASKKDNKIKIPKKDITKTKTKLKTENKNSAIPKTNTLLKSEKKVFKNRKVKKKRQRKTARKMKRK